MVGVKNHQSAKQTLTWLAHLHIYSKINDDLLNDSLLLLIPHHLCTCAKMPK